MRSPRMSLVLLSIALGLTGMNVPAAKVVHEWSFESQEPFHDSVGRVKLNPTRGVERIEVQDGPPAARGHAIAFPGVDEALLITPSVPPLTSSFEVVLEFRLTGAPGAAPMTLAQQGLFHRPDLLGWVLQWVPPADGSTAPGVIQLLLSDGKRLERITSTLAPEPGTDYRLTVSVDLEGGGARLQLQPLDESLPAATDTRALALASLNSQPVKVFCAGDSTGRMAAFPFRGLIHRIVLQRGLTGR